MNVLFHRSQNFLQMRFCRLHHANRCSFLTRNLLCGLEKARLNRNRLSGGNPKKHEIGLQQSVVIYGQCTELCNKPAQGSKKSPQATARPKSGLIATLQ